MAETKPLTPEEQEALLAHYGFGIEPGAIRTAIAYLVLRVRAARDQEWAKAVRALERAFLLRREGGDDCMFGFGDACMDGCGCAPLRALLAEVEGK